MEVILLKDIENLGLKYDIINVKPGYGRNFLIPNAWVELATEKAKQALKKKLENQIAEEKTLIEESKKIIDKLKNTKIILKAKVGSKEKLFGSINSKTLSEEFLKLNIKIDKKYIKIPGNNIKKTGKYNAKIRLHRLVEYQLEFEIISIK